MRSFEKSYKPGGWCLISTESYKSLRASKGDSPVIIIAERS